MGTAVLAGFLPGMDRYTYWQPPGYFFCLSLILWLVAPAHHFLADRLFSWFLGVVVLVLGAATLKRLTANSGWAILGLVVLGTQVTFIQAANVGRMEMLSLACVLAALNAYLAYRQKSSLYLLAGSSFLAGLAMVCHTVGILAASLMVVHELALPQAGRRRAKEVLIFLGCILAALLPWIIYIAQAPDVFAAQMLAQSARKSSYLSTLLTSRGYMAWLRSPCELAIWPLGHRIGGVGGDSVWVPGLMLGVGVAALLAEGRRRVEASLLGTWALAGYAVNLFLPEFWYAVHFATPCCLLLGWAAAAPAKRWVRTLALTTLVFAAISNFGRAKLLWQINQDGSRRYNLYCSTLERIIPPNSSVLLATIPDPYFGWLGEKKSYQIHEFVPEGIPVDNAQAEEALGKIDYVVGSACCRPDYLANYLLAHGRTEANLGERSFLSPPVVIWSLHAQPNPPLQRDEGKGVTK
jgi:hypothetical protein